MYVYIYEGIYTQLQQKKYNHQTLSTWYVWE